MRSRLLLVLAVMLLALVLPAAAAAQASSPPSGQIAFVRGGNIWVMDATGGNARRLTTSAKAESDPTWSPDGRTIAFVRADVTEGYDVCRDKLCLMNADGTNLRSIAFELGPQTMPGTAHAETSYGIQDIAWAPNGIDICVAASAWAWEFGTGVMNNNQLYLVHPDGTSQRRIGPLIQGIYGGINGLSWRPDGAQLLLSELSRQGGGGAVIYDLDSNEVSVPFPDEYGGRTMWNAVWSPDGKQIAACVQDDPSAYLGPTHVAIIDMQTRDERALRISAQPESPRIQPSWSPDGSWLACSAWNGADGSVGQPDAFLVSTDGAESRLLQADASDPAWSPTAFSPTPTPTAKVTLKLSGLKSGAMRLGRRVTAKGKVTPTSLAGSQVKLTVQKKRSARWITLKSVKRTIGATGAYSWKYKPAKKGAYRMRATIAKTAAHLAGATKWLAFKVK